MIGGSFCEVNRRRRSRRGIRENFPQSSDRSRTLDPGLRRDDGVLPRLVTAQRGELLTMTIVSHS